MAQEQGHINGAHVNHFIRRPPRWLAGIKVFTVMRIPVYVTPSLLLIMAMLAWMFGLGYFPEKYASANYSRPVYALMGVVGTLLFFLSVLVHEVAHCVLARTRTGGRIPIRKITLYFWGGLSELTEEPHTAAGEFVISFSGPLTSVVIGGAMWLASLPMAEAGWPVFVYAVLEYIGKLNVFLGVTNLLPGFPLDGGRVLRAAIWSATGDFLKATTISSGIGRALGLGTAVVAILLVFSNSINFVMGLFLVMMGLFIDQSARAALAFARAKAAMSGLKVSDAMETGMPPVWQGTTLEEAARDYLIRWRAEAVAVVDDAGHLRGVLTADMLNSVARFDWPRVLVKELFEEDTVPAFARPDEPLADVFTLMLRHSLAAMPVLDGEARLVGMITMKDLNRVVSLHSRYRG